MEEAVRLAADETGYFVLYCGERALLHGLDAAQARRFADTLGGVIEAEPTREPYAGPSGDG